MGKDYYAKTRVCFVDLSRKVQSVIRKNVSEVWLLNKNVNRCDRKPCESSNESNDRNIRKFVRIFNFRKSITRLFYARKRRRKFAHNYCFDNGGKSGIQKRIIYNDVFMRIHFRAGVLFLLGKFGTKRKICIRIDLFVEVCVLTRLARFEFVFW